MVEINGFDLNINDVYNIAINDEKVLLSNMAITNIKKSNESLKNLLKTGKEIYGVNTGFGSLLDKHISPENMEEIQNNLIRSHSSGVGEPLPKEYVKAIMVIRANTLSKGYSGVTVDLIERLLKMVNENIIPVIPRYGSVGASGDLAPLAHIGLALIGEGDVFYKNERKKSKDVFNELNLNIYKFKEKEGVALINGTSVICGILSIELKKSYDLLESAIASSSLSFEGLSGTDKAFTKWAIESRNHDGQVKIASFLRNILSNSEIVKNANKEKIQDAYSLRCIPQLYGSVVDTLNYVKKVLTIEINSATDNPLVYNDEYISTGNFHGEPVALVSDFLAIALTDLGNMIERRIARIVDTKLSNLPPFLIQNSGLYSGYMIPQYTAAALCNVNKTLVHPNSADSIPTSANQEDHVSMGTNSTLKLIDIVKNVKFIVAIEYLLGSQSLEFRKYSMSEFDESIYNEIRNIVKPLTKDRPSTDDIYNILNLMNSNNFKDKINKLIKLN